MNVDFLQHDKIKTKLFTEEDITQAIKECSFQKAMGEDWFYGELLKDKNVG